MLVTYNRQMIRAMLSGPSFAIKTICRQPLILFLFATLFWGCKTKETTSVQKQKAPVAQSHQAILDNEPLEDEPPQKQDPIYGTDIGLDHVAMVVNDLKATKTTYQKTFGFDNVIEGKLPNGLNNVVFYFEDGTYIEFLHPYDPIKASYYVDALKTFQGGLFYVLATSSAKQTDAFLQKRGFRLSKPHSGTIQLKGDAKEPDELWRTFDLEKAAIPGDPFLFIEYKPSIREEFMDKLADRQIRRRHFRHRNTALSLKAVWMAVSDLDAAIKAYRDVGFPIGKTFTDPRLGAKGCVIEAGQGQVLLYSPETPKSPVAAFLAQRKKPMILGLSLWVGSIIPLKNMLKQSPRINSTSSASLLGISLLISPEHAHGIWLEFYQKPGITKPR